MDELELNLAKELDALKSDAKDGITERTKKLIIQCEIQSKVNTYIDGENQEQDLQWLRSVSTEAEYDEAIRERYPGTCLWIFEKDFFKDWHGGAGAQNILWIHGGPGMGKTFLSASIVEFLQKRSSLPVAYFFCRNEDVSKSDTLSIVRSWIFQLASQRANAIEVVRSMKVGDLTEARLWQIFSMVLDSMPGCCYLVLDGADECHDYNPNSHSRRSGKIKKFFQNLLKSIENTTITVKTLIVSRDEVIIRSALTTPNPSQTTGLPYIVNEYIIVHDDTAKDIQSCARGIVDSVHIKNKDTRERLVKQLSTSCEGMFLWVRLEGERFEEGMDSKDLEEIIASMPRGLGHSYQRNLERISRLEKKLRDQARSILRWILFAFEPLSVQTLLHLLAVKQDGSVPDEVSYPIDDDRIRVKILRLCGSLVETRGSSTSPEKKTIHFTHFSVKEFLINDQNLHDHPTLAKCFYTAPELNHRILTRACLLYILSYPLSIPENLRIHYQTPSSPTLLQPTLSILQHSPLNYPAEHWVEHLRLSPKDHNSQCIDLQRRLFTESPEFRSWRHNRKGPGSSIDKRTPFRIASNLGLVDICKEMMMSPDIDINEVDSNDNTALDNAIDCQNLEILELLLNQPGINVSLSKDDGGPLSYRLPEISTDNPAVNVGPSYGTRFGLTDLIYMPTEIENLFFKRQDFDASAVDNNRGPILRRAVLSSKGVTVDCDSVMTPEELAIERLLEKDDINVNEGIDEGLPVLLVAVVFWKPAIIMLLLEKSQLDVNTRDWDQRTPLHRVIQDDVDCMIETVDFLVWKLNIGNNLHYQDSFGYLENRKPKQQEVIQRFLARKDLQINSRDKNGQTPLHWAATLDNSKCKPSGAQITKLLLTRGDIDINIQDNKGCTPLFAAVQSSRIGSVRELLTRDDIDVNLQNNNGRTPLCLAIAFNDDETITELLTRGDIDVNLEDRQGLTPLRAAMNLKNYKVVQQLVAREDTNLNLQDHKGCTPLFVAVKRTDAEVIQRLLTRPDLDVTIPDNTGTTPLMVATELRQQLICQWLLSRGCIGTDLPQGEYPTQASTEKVGHLAPLQRSLKRGSSELDSTIAGILPRSKSPRI